MNGALLIATVGAVGVLHTLVPDHWAPIVVIARRRGWSAARTAGAAAVAGLGHVTSTLLLGVVVWVVGASAAAHYGRLVSEVSAAALIAFGAWIAYGGWKEARSADGGDALDGAAAGDFADGPQRDPLAERTALVLVLGSSPMLEGLPAFLSASTHGVALLAAMAAVFGAATVATYVATSVAGLAGLYRLSLGPLERYGEFLSGAFVALIGCYSLVTA